MNIYSAQCQPVAEADNVDIISTLNDPDRKQIYTERYMLPLI